MKFIQLLILAAVAAGLSGCVLNEASFNANRAMLRKHPEIAAQGLAKCEKQVKYIHISAKRHVAGFMRTDMEGLPQKVCSRLLKGYVSGRMQYQDLKALVTGQKFTPAMVAILRAR